MASDIVLIVYNNLEVTRPCIESILRCRRQEDNLIIVDNGSDAPTAAYLSSVAKANPAIPVQILRISVNQGFIKAANAGLRAAKAEYVCLICNDTIVTKGWLGRMEAHLAKNADIGLVNPLSTTFGVYPGRNETIDDVGLRCETAEGRITETSACVGFCVLARRSLLDKIGYIDEIFGAGYFEDSDMSRRVIRAGFRCVIAQDAYVWHKEHSTFKTGQREELFKRNRAIFESRWGRPARLLCVAGKILDTERGVKSVTEFCLNQARQGNWIHLVVPKDYAVRVSAVNIHGNIKVISLERWKMAFVPLWMILTRRKKPYTRVIFDTKEIPYGR